jgi:hypothetical protein
MVGNPEVTARIGCAGITSGLRDTPAIVKKSNRISNFQPHFWLVCENLSGILQISGALSEGDLLAELRTLNFAS